MNEEERIIEFLERSKSGAIQTELINYFKANSKSKKISKQHEEVLDMIEKKESEITRLKNEIMQLENQLSMILQRELDYKKIK